MQSCYRPGRRFLNRLLGLPVAKQNLLFGYFSATLVAEIRAAKVCAEYHACPAHCCTVATMLDCSTMCELRCM